MDEPRSVLAAPSHPDPYPWYARLRAQQPLFFDAAIGLWVAAEPALVEQALREPMLRVRPPAEPVPKALVGGAAGEVFAQLVRMTDGEFHARHRPEVAAAAGRFDTTSVLRASSAAARDLASRVDANALLTALPVQAMARLLGVADAELDRTVAWVHDFTAGIAASADASAVQRANAAAQALMSQGEAEGLPRVAAANRIALMQQALDATAGLIGNAVVAAQRQPAEQDFVALVEGVAQRDPAVHNTRRFAAADLVLGGQRIAAGQGMVLLLLEGLGFGSGAHACPGERIAKAIAAAGLQALSPVSHCFGELKGYRPLPNARVPIFAAS
jgi:cytochrome P450